MTNAQEHPLFTSALEAQGKLKKEGYLASREIADIVHLAGALDKPILVEGPAGTGKTELAIAIAASTGTRLIRLQCYQGIDESRALYEWDYRKQLLSIQSADVAAEVTDVFSAAFLVPRPLLQAVMSDERVVLLIDEVDQLDVETEALLLELLSSFQITIPELGTFRAEKPPLVILTSNGNRDLSDALRRRCLYAHIDYPVIERESEIIRSRLPDIDATVAVRIAETVAALRALEFKKPPSVSETLDWARTLQLLGATEIGDAELLAHAGVLLKHKSDIDALHTRLVGTGRGTP